MGSIKRSMSKREHKERPIQQRVEYGGQKAEQRMRERETEGELVRRSNKQANTHVRVQPKQTSFALPHIHKHRLRERERERAAKRAMCLCKLSRSLPELNFSFWFSRRLRLVRFWRVRLGVLREFSHCSYSIWRSFKIYKNKVYNNCLSITSMFWLACLTQL